MARRLFAIPTLFLLACAGGDDAPDTDTDVPVSTDNSDDEDDNPSDDEEPDAPDAPDELLARATSTTTVAVSWPEVDDADEYELQLREGEGDFDDFDTVDELELDIDALIPGATYGFRVRACSDDGGCSDWTDDVEVVLPLGPVPAAPDDLTVVTQGTTNLILDWNDHATDETAYVIAWSLDQGVTFEDYPEIPENSQSATDSGLISNATYCYQVRARNEVGDSPPTSTVCATTTAQTAPGVPTDLVATLSADLQILLTWRNPTPNTGYVVYESVNGSSYNNAGTVTPGNLAGAYIDGLSPATTYRYRVTATNGQGSSSQSAESNVVTTPAAAAPTRTTFENDAAYPIVSLVVDGVEQLPQAPRAIPTGATLSLALSVGAHTYTAESGFWSGSSRTTMYSYSGSVTQDDQQTELVTLTNPALPLLLTRFEARATYMGEYWEGTTLHEKRLRFFQDGTYTLFDDGAVAGSGSVSLISYPGSFLVTFRLSGIGGADAVMDERTGSFFLRNGPADWPTIQYGWIGP